MVDSLSRRPGVLWAAHALVLVLCGPFDQNLHAQGVAGNSESSCSYESWSAAVPLGSATSLVLRNSTLAIGGGTGYVTGVDVGPLDEGPLPSPAFVGLTLAGEPIPPPPLGKYFLHPRAAAGDDGTLHLIWAEPDTAETLRLLGIDLRAGDPVHRNQYNQLTSNTLYYARYTPGGGWRDAVPIYAGRGLVWRFASAPSLQSRGPALIAVPDHTFGLDTLALIRVEKAGAAVHRLALKALYSSLAMDSSRAVVAFIGPYPQTRGQGNNVLVTTSANGRDWSSPRLVNRSEGMDATDVRVVAGSDGSLHLVWAQNLSGGLSPEVVRHVYSLDWGETWSQPQDLDAPDFFQNLQAAPDGCGGVAVAYEHWTEHSTNAERGTLWTTRWNGGWSAPVAPFPDLNSFGAALATDENGCLVLVWSARPANVRGFDPVNHGFRPMLSRACRGRPSDSDRVGVTHHPGPGQEAPP